MGKACLILAFLVSSLAISVGQQREAIDLKLLKFQGLSIELTKDELKQKFGDGKQVKTNYSCGFFSGDQPNAPFFQIVFQGFIFIGSDKEKFHLQFIDFDVSGNLKLQYENHVLTGQTTKDDFQKIFGSSVKEQFKQGKNLIFIIR